MNACSFFNAPHNGKVTPIVLGTSGSVPIYFGGRQYAGDVSQKSSSRVSVMVSSTVYITVF